MSVNSNLIFLSHQRRQHQQRDAGSGDDKTISLLKAFAVFGVGFVMRPVGSVLFGIYGDRFGRRLALSAVIFLMAFSTVAIGLLPTYAQAGVLAPILLVVFRLLQGLSASGGKPQGSRGGWSTYTNSSPWICRSVPLTREDWRPPSSSSRKGSAASVLASLV